GAGPATTGRWPAGRARCAASDGVLKRQKSWGSERRSVVQVLQQRGLFGIALAQDRALRFHARTGLLDLLVQEGPALFVVGLLAAEMQAAFIVLNKGREVCGQCLERLGCDRQGQ